MATKTAKKTTPAKAKKTPAKTKTETKKTGVIASIAEILLKATEAKPVSKEDILDQLAKRFPDRSRDSMSGTVGVQVPGRIARERGITVEKTEDGRYYAM